MHTRAGISTSKIDDIGAGDDAALTSDVPLSALDTTGATTVEAVPVAMGLLLMMVRPELRSNVMMLYDLVH